MVDFERSGNNLLCFGYDDISDCDLLLGKISKSKDNYFRFTPNKNGYHITCGQLKSICLKIKEMNMQ